VSKIVNLEHSAVVRIKVIFCRSDCSSFLEKGPLHVFSFGGGKFDNTGNHLSSVDFTVPVFKRMIDENQPPSVNWSTVGKMRDPT
jgi:hypothetical protein